MFFRDMNGNGGAMPDTLYMLAINRNFETPHPDWCPIAAFVLQSDAQLYLANCGPDGAKCQIFTGSIGWDANNRTPCFIIPSKTQDYLATPEYGFIQGHTGRFYGVTPDLATGQCFVGIPNPKSPWALTTGYLVGN